jgi:hypothetical protein
MIDGDPDGGPATAADSTSCSLDWVTNQEDQKITVATSLASPSCVLRVEALNPSGGTAAGEVVLGPASQDFVVDVSRGRGRCDLGYSATAFDLTTATNYVHTVTYTITDAR